MQIQIHGGPRLRQRIAVGAAVAAIGAAVPAAGLAQPRAGVAVNAGAQATATAFTTRATLTLHRENGDLRAYYGVDAGALIDLGASVRLWRQVGLGLGVSRFQTTGAAGVAAGLPHPFHLEQFRAVDGSAATTRQETAVHVQLRVGATVGTRLDVTLFGGPTFFDVQQTLVSDILFEETYPTTRRPSRGRRPCSGQRQRWGSTPASIWPPTSPRPWASGRSSGSAAPSSI